MKSFLAQQWEAVGANPSSAGRLQTIGVGVETAEGPVEIGVNAAGARMLLLPLSDRMCVREDTVSRGIQVLIHGDVDDRGHPRRRALVRCADSRHWEAFDSLIITLLEEVQDGREVDPAQLLASLRAALAKAPALLAREEALGLWGELLVAADLAILGMRSLESWTATKKSAKDFTFRAAQLEVKTTATTQPRRVRIAGLSQLEPTDGKPLHLLVNVVEPDPHGRSLASLCDDLCAAGLTREQLHDALKGRGVSPEAAIAYDEERWRLTGQGLWVVGEHFPRIVRGSFPEGPPPGILSVSYEIDVDSVWPSRMDAARQSATLQEFIS